MSLSIPPRPDLGSSVEGVAATDDGRPRSTWGWWEGIGVFILASFAGGIAAIPVLAWFGKTSVNGAIGLSEILQGIVGDVLTVVLLVIWLARWHQEWRAAMVLPPPRDRVV